MIIQRYKIFHTIKIFVNCTIQCLDDDFRNQALDTFNCSPPYFTDDKNLWCRMEMNQTLKQRTLLSEYVDSRMESIMCPPPCKLTK